jgi:hypothetical protein
MAGGSPAVPSLNRASSGLETGTQGNASGSASKPLLPTPQAQLWQAWEQLRMTPSPVTYAQWQAVANQRHPVDVSNSQAPTAGQSTPTMAESSHEGQPGSNGPELSAQDAETKKSV